LAYLWGARRILLLGFDMQCGPDGESHWFGDHPLNQGFMNPKKFNSWIRHFEVMGRDLADQGISVFNCSRQSAIGCFPRMAIEQVPG
jgi:hypothetical protein